MTIAAFIAAFAAVGFNESPHGTTEADPYKCGSILWIWPMVYLLKQRHCSYSYKSHASYSLIGLIRYLVSALSALELFLSLRYSETYLLLKEIATPDYKVFNSSVNFFSTAFT